MLKKGLILLLLAVVFQTPVKGSTLEASQAAIVSYDLAFPGMLPDHPLYKLKVIRDKIRLFLMADPKKRIEFYRLKADKEILATAMLVDKNKIELAGKTALKAEHNYTLLVGELRNFPRKKDPEIFQKLKLASLKHQEVLNSLIQRIPEDQRKTLEDVLFFSKLNLKTIENFEQKKFYE